MNVLLYRRTLAFRSGAGQLIAMQASALEQAGARVRIGGERGRLRYLLRAGRYPRRVTAARAGRLARRGDGLVVDHEMAVPDATVVFVHNLATALAEYLPETDAAAQRDREARFFAALAPDTPLIANSFLVRDGLVRLFGIDAARVHVRHPGIDTFRFSPVARARLRDEARAAAGCPPDAPLLGLVTSGHFAKRGLNDFLSAAERVRHARPDARFLVVGSRALPPHAAAHALVRAGHLVHWPKSSRPERAFAALDVMLYPAVYEEFGMAVLEAQAMGVPVVVSRRVGAAETLPDAYAGWVPTAPEPAELAEKCIALIGDRAAADRLAAAGREAAAAVDAGTYGAACADLILAQKPRLM